MSATDLVVTREITVDRALRGRRIDVAGVAFQTLLLLCLLVCLFFIIVLVGTVWSDGWPVIQERGTSFFTSDLSRCSEEPCLSTLKPAGVAQGIFGSLALAILVVIVSFPLGIATAVYLEEYAKESRLKRFVQLNIRNLSGVPSVVYGLLGLAVFVQILGTNRGEGGGFTGGRTIISGGLTLAILVLPIVIITASEALRAVPQSLREGGYGVGATKWEVTRRLVLPNAFAGILTGTVLSLSRALGETAPLILVGAFYGTFFTTGDASFTEKFSTTYTALPQIVFQWTTDPDRAFTNLAAAAILVLLSLTLLANLTAVLLRNRYEKRW
ncbi:MAG: phosphate ABC transporter permease PstA [Actinobacteria bacterium]|nr:phosphate ABC transporter permease PstA [Actinomycetota bacterium]